MTRWSDATFLIRLSAGIVLLGQVTACGPPLNSMDGLRGEQSLTALDGVSERSREAAPTRPLGTVVSFDRSEWSPQLIELDLAQVQHHPSYGTSRPPCSMAASSMGWPTLESAFDTGTDRSRQLMNGVLAPPAAGLDLVVMPFRIFITPPWTVMTSPEGLQILPTPDHDVQRVRNDWLDPASTGRNAPK